MLVSIIFIPIGVASLYASQDVWLSETHISFSKFILTVVADLENLFGRLSKLLIVMKLTAYLRTLEVPKT